MDLILYFIVALVYMVGMREKDKIEVIDRETRTNPSFYRDKDAFMRYVHEIMGV